LNSVFLTRWQKLNDERVKWQKNQALTRRQYKNCRFILNREQRIGWENKFLRMQVEIVPLIFTP
jgi:hypothetical protein